MGLAASVNTRSLSMDVCATRERVAAVVCVGFHLGFPSLDFTLVMFWLSVDWPPDVSTLTDVESR